ncbi:thiamine diphosphokinase [Sporolactobacillus sp. CPB3-1]|uniref:Thiamine diphosphokinase n=1 Tax=Sporolactobacillus mangiferae TaxID=2940498 RepID=A0ABT0M9G0_9BACL|nr:thiamine diphosphokinase [Sporolactobacillus mangiferae]MCL1630904.1 thiamine diphosphokinase [Sporolactobacillus mangiferae]
MGIVAGGPENLIPDLTGPDFADILWVGADHGTILLMKQKIRPICAFGDFDSLSPEERAFLEASKVEVHAYIPEKDKTDLELALDWVLKQNPDQCILCGVTGGRMDHGLAAVQLLMKSVERKTDLMIVDKNNRITLLAPGTYAIKNDPSFRYLSFLALTERVQGLHLSGVKYPLENAILPLGSSLCISNEPQSDVFTVAFDQGYLLMMRCRDQLGT